MIVPPAPPNQLQMISLVRLGLKPRDLTASSVFAVLTSLGAWISIPLPMTPVPITLQVFFVLLSGVVLGARLGALSQITYVLLGLIGFPVFAGATSGPGVLVGPTGGYLIGFVVGAYVTGKAAESALFSGFQWLLVATLLGLIPIHTAGAVWLWAWLRISYVPAIGIGVLPFLPADAAKACVAAFVASRPQVRERFRQGKSPSQRSCFRLTTCRFPYVSVFR